MSMKYCLTVFLSFLISGISSGQATDYSPGYQTLMMTNPAVTGSEGDGKLRLSYMNFYPGNGYNLHSVYLSFDTYYEPVHGGTGFFLAGDHLGGIVNDLRGGFSYAYFLKAGKDLYINAGLAASFYHRGYDFGGAILPDQIDPVGGVINPSSEILSDNGNTVLDLAAGVLITTGRISGGLSVSHLAGPDPGGSGAEVDRIGRKLMVHVAADLDLNERLDLIIRPVASMEMSKGWFSASAGAALGNKLLSVNSLIIYGSNDNMDVQAGFSVKTGRIMLYYNYRFNASSGNNLLPFSLMHQTGVAFSLYNVEKRNGIRTINLPEM